ncbi:MAG: peptidylprolyl isomerase [Bacteroidetes bacterium QS_9_68_14]|nr:MAG: peptidylprolyl isomerase [Bacteroidetes bacterium QS_9_68_14]
MGTMTKIRNRAGSILITVLAIAFGGLWMLQDTGVFDAVSGGGAQRGEGIITVDGDAIRSQTYSQAVDQQVQMLQGQGQEVTPQQRDQIGDRVYDRLVNARLQKAEMDRLGITVTAREVEQAVLGPNPDPRVKQALRSLIPAQQLPQDGQIDQQFINTVLGQQQFEPVVQRLEQFMRRQIRNRKLTALLGATVHVSREDVQDHHRRQNRSVDTRYVALPYAQVSDSAVSASASEVESYYEEHKEEEYRRPKTYRVQYITRPKQATAEDTASVTSELEKLRPRFAQTENDSLFLAQNGSEGSYSSAYRSATALDSAIAEAVFPNPDTGEIIGPIFAGQQAHLVKVTGTRPAEQPAVRARHILIRGDGEEALQQLRQIKERIAGGQMRFAAAARQYSEDPGSASQGGSLGWFGRGQMQPAFEEAAFSATPGQLVGPVQTSYGSHLIKVEARADEQVQIADLARGLRPSVATLSETEEQMRDVSVFAEEEGDFAGQAERAGLSVQTATATASEDGELPLAPIAGLGPSQRIKAFLEEAEAGATSDVVELDDRFVVLNVTETTPEGFRPLDEVRSQVRTQVLRQKKQDVQTRKLRQALDGASGDLDRLARAVGTVARAKSDVAFDTRTIPALGTDPKFVGTALGLQDGQTSGVVAGENGAFVVKATRVSEPPELTEQRRQQLHDQLLQQKKQQVRQKWLAGLREDATIQDNRAQYQ